MLATHTPDQLRGLLFDLELHWLSPCSNCQYKGPPQGHAARVAALEQLIVGGWLDPSRRWPAGIAVPEFLKPMIGEAVPDGAR